MDSIFKSFLGVFFLLVLSCTGIGLVEASIDARSADSYLSSVVSQIESGHYSTSVVSACKKDAESRGYELNVDIQENTLGECFGTAELTYVYQVSFLGLKQTHIATADIR
ncbi:MAG: hypothetical protein IJ679_12295 [Lachnospiraceae bacterium]|nr:hypothetical protein [Lachnospiraceae bacterium]